MSEFKIGDRVRIVGGRSFPSRLHAGKEGRVSTRSPHLVESEVPEHFEAFPVAVILDNAAYPTVWAVDEVEHIE
jgi:hypothetical protein